MSENTKLPVSFWIVAALGLLWNLIGFAIYYMSVSATPEMLAQMYETEAELNFVTGMPTWATGAQGFAVTTGVLGCVTLFLRRAFAKWLFIASLAGILVQDTYGFIMADAIGVFGAQSLILPLVVILVAVALVGYSSRAIKAGWLR
jgi:hypothetical protein